MENRDYDTQLLYIINTIIKKIPGLFVWSNLPYISKVKGQTRDGSTHVSSWLICKIFDILVSILLYITCVSTWPSASTKHGERWDWLSHQRDKQHKKIDWRSKRFIYPHKILQHAFVGNIGSLALLNWGNKLNTLLLRTAMTAQNTAFFASNVQADKQRVSSTWETKK